MRTRGEPGDIRCDRAARHAQQTPDPPRHSLTSNSSPSTEEKTEAPAGSLRCARRHTGIQDPARVKPSPQSPSLASGNNNVLSSHALPNPSPGIQFGRQPRRLKARTLQALGRNALDPASCLQLPVCPERASYGSWSTRGDGICGHRAGPPHAVLPPESDGGSRARAALFSQEGWELAHQSSCISPALADAPAINTGIGGLSSRYLQWAK